MASTEQKESADARGYVDDLLARAIRADASDIHLEPIGGDKHEVKFRIDGLLERIELLPDDVGKSAVLRLMVMGQLLTYRLDIPQEGRIRTSLRELAGSSGSSDVSLDLRLAIMPVAHGIRAVVRLPA